MIHDNGSVICTHPKTVRGLVNVKTSVLMIGQADFLISSVQLCTDALHIRREGMASQPSSVQPTPGTGQDMILENYR